MLGMTILVELYQDFLKGNGKQVITNVAEVGTREPVKENTAATKPLSVNDFFANEYAWTNCSIYYFVDPLVEFVPKDYYFWQRLSILK